jgi:hypothetical protein
MHRAWQAVLGGQVVLFHQYSPDDGAHWSETVRVGGSARTGGLAGMALDEGGRLNLLLLSGETRLGGGAGGEAATLLQRWVWQGETWQAAESLPLDELGDPTALSVAAPANILAALYSGDYLPKAGETSLEDSGPRPTLMTQYGLFLSGRKLDDLPQAPAAAATFTPAPSDGLQSTETPTPVISKPTPTFAVQAPGGVGGSSGILIFGAIPAVLVVIGVFILLARRSGGRSKE